MLDKPHEDLVEIIYEAAIMPETWPHVLTKLGAIAGCDKALLFATNHGRDMNGWVANDVAAPLIERFVSEGWSSRNDIAPRAIGRKSPDFSVDLDLFTQQEIDTNPLYQDFMIPAGMAWGTGTAICSPSEDTIIVSLHRALEQGPVHRSAVATLTALRPHLARAALMAARLRLEQARLAVKALEALGLPAVAIRQERRISMANALFQRKMPSLAQDRQRRLVFTTAETDRLFGEALTVPQQGRSFAVIDPDGARFIGHLIPIVGAARDVFGAMDAIVVLVEMGRREGIDPHMIQSLFDLTPAEAAVAAGLMQGKTVEQIAADRQTSIETVRSQLKATMAKTGTGRQLDLVQLLSQPRWSVRSD